MDPFSFQDELLHGDLFWALSPELLDLAPMAPLVSCSAFIPYTRPEVAVPPVYRNGSTNIHQRMIGFLRSIPKPEPECTAVGESRGFRHMMRERQRREKLSQGYSDLYSMMSSRSKADKNSIVQSAAVYVRELKGVKENLKQRNEELKAKLDRRGSGGEGERSVRINVTKPSSSIDSMITALVCLKRMGVKATGIRSRFSDHELSAVVNVETRKTSAAELERAVKVAMMEVGDKFGETFPRSNGWRQQCHVECTF